MFPANHYKVYEPAAGTIIWFEYSGYNCGTIDGKWQYPNDKKQTNTNINDDAIRAANAAAASFLRSEGLSDEGFENLIFSTGEKYEKNSKLNEGTQNNKKKKKKKKKKAKVEK